MTLAPERLAILREHFERCLCPDCLAVTAGDPAALDLKWRAADPHRARRDGARALHAALTTVLATGALAADQASAARGVLEQLDRRVPEWVAEDPEQTVLAALADGRGPGSRRAGRGGADRHARRRRRQRERPAGPHGRRAPAPADRARRPDLARRAAAGAETPADPVTEPDALVDLVYAEHRPGRWAHRPSVQAIGRLADAAFDVLAGELRTRAACSSRRHRRARAHRRRRGAGARALGRAAPSPTGGFRRPPSPIASSRSGRGRRPALPVAGCDGAA